MIRRFFAMSAIASLALLVPTVASTVLPSVAQAEVEAPQTEADSIRQVLGVAFQSPEGFSEVRTLARRTNGIVYPNHENQRPQMIVRFAELESSADQWVKFSASEQMMHAKYLFLGNNSPSGEYVQRTFFGNPITGEAQTIRTRDGYRYIELFILTLEKSERQIAIAFESDTRMPLATVETAIDTVTESLQDIAKPSKKYRKKMKRSR